MVSLECVRIAKSVSRMVRMYRDGRGACGVVCVCIWGSVNEGVQKEGMI